jgi:hypothetical protein
MGAPSTLKERSAAAPVVVSADGGLFLAWTGTDLHLNLALSGPDGHFGPVRRLPYKSWTRVWESSTTAGRSDSSWKTVPLGPALTLTGTEPHLAWTDARGNLNVLSAPDDPSGAGGLEAPVSVGQNTQLAPALVAWGDELVLAWTGTDRHVNCAISRRRTFHTSWRLEAKTPFRPVLGVHGDCLVVAWTGTDHHLNLMLLRDGSFGPPRRLDETSRTSPALCRAGNDLIIAWAGTDRRLNLAMAHPDGRSIRLNEKTIAGPSICSSGDAVVLAWTGTDARLNLMKVDPPH